MRIASVTARTIRWSITGRGAARGQTERAAVLLEVRGDRGGVGLGEAAPLPGMSPDTLADAEHALAALARRAPFEVADRDAASAIAADLAGPRASTASPAARFAIETALLDALARERGISLAALLTGHADATASSPGHASRGASVPLAAVVDDPDAARAALAAGIRCLKIKLAADDDPDRVRAIAAVAPGARLRIDANRSWSRVEVAARLAALADLPIDYVEEPCLDAHQLLTGPLACRLALDESLAALAPDELDAALHSPRLAAVVLKPTLLGGLSVALALAARARSAGVSAVASHGLEGPVGTAACAELALALGHFFAGDPSDRASSSAAARPSDHFPMAPAGLAAHPALTGWQIDVPQLAPDHLHAAAAPGLGFTSLELTDLLQACPTLDLGGPQGARPWR
ncbi:MAG TPA: mandelate racemase/muconate lactonizing enzyme family protein [Kofleriaceae bacterium]|nr:mandelate racemase/muconate lactonizing enzyme family protein [Kofleriaceae bacterium]